ncbi:MAG: hypothetical protein M1838_002072 [Thelocarpon superellum]|nr:MAG: hypothetical protein M1838_002072 [Thelocarpon superellum]
MGGVTPAQAIADAYYVVAGIALGLKALVEQGPQSEGTKRPPYLRFLRDDVILGVTDADIGLSYLGVAGASSVGISLCISLFAHAHFIRSALCAGDATGHSDKMKAECKRAYVLAAGASAPPPAVPADQLSELGGTTQLTALHFAPVVGQ